MEKGEERESRMSKAKSLEEKTHEWRAGKGL